MEYSWDFPLFPSRGSSVVRSMRTEAPYSRSAKKETWTARNIVPAARLQPERYFYSIWRLTAKLQDRTPLLRSNMAATWAAPGMDSRFGKVSSSGGRKSPIGVRGKPPHHVHYDHMDDDSDIE